MSITGAESISQNGRSAYRKLSIELWDNSGCGRRTMYFSRVGVSRLQAGSREATDVRAPIDISVAPGRGSR